MPSEQREYLEQKLMGGDCLEDNKWVKAFYARYGPILTVMYMQMGFSHTEAADLAFDVITDILVFKLDQFNGTGSLDSWVLTIGRRRALSLLRRPKLDVVESNHSLDEQGDRLDKLAERASFRKWLDNGASFASPSDEEAPEVSIPTVEFLAVRDLLAQLSENDQKILIYHHESNGVTHEQAAQAFRIDVTAARVRYHRAKSRFIHLAEKDPRLQAFLQAQKETNYGKR